MRSPTQRFGAFGGSLPVSHKQKTPLLRGSCLNALGGVYRRK